MSLSLQSDTRHRTFAELLIDCEEDRTWRAVLVGMLREADRDAKGSPGSRRRKATRIQGRGRTLEGPFFVSD